MTNADLFNDAGTKISAINENGVQALKTADPVTAASIYAMLYFAGAAGKAVQAVADAVLPRPTPAPTPVTGLRPGQIVVDAGGSGSGEAPYTGSIAPSFLSVEDWQVFSQNYERMPFYTIFSSSPAGQERDPATGRSLHQGDLAQYVDVAAYKAKGGLLAPWL